MASSGLKGNVRRVDKFLISGWALDTNDPLSSPGIQIVQQGRPVITIRPQFPAVGLRDTLKLSRSSAPQLHSFRLWLPLGNGVKPEIPFSIVFEDSGSPLINGRDRRLSVIDEIDRNVWDELQTEMFFVPGYRMEEGVLKCHAKVAHVEGLQKNGLMVGASRTEDCRVVDNDPALFGRKSYNYVFKISDADFSDDRLPTITIRPDCSPSPPEGTKMALHQSLLRLDVPRTAFDKSTLRSPLPTMANIIRVSGRKSDQVNFLVSGLTTFSKLDAMCKFYSGVGISDLDVVVDWGVGCGRVVRHLLEQDQANRASAQTVIGVDIDEINVKWCQENLSSLSPNAQFNVLSLEGFDLPGGSVDLLYGISIFTHLSEYHQHKWLSEIRRVLKPGALAILTVNGEAKFCRQREEIGLPFVQKFGFFDGVPDSAIGADRSDYYRSTLHLRPYIVKNWGMYFEILDFIVMANAFQQDFVVVRRPGSPES